MKARDKDGSKNKINKNGFKEKTKLPYSSNRFKSPRDGKYLELIGFYNPIAEPAEIKINEEVALKWLRNGAILTDTAKDLLSKAGIMKKFHEERQSK